MSIFTPREHRYMKRALALARRGSGYVWPNPMVGAVVVNNGSIVGYGWHKAAGGAHAEIEALDMAGARAKGSTLYVTLEPCNHTGKTPPCVGEIVKRGVREVVFAMTDPNPRIKGGGGDALRLQGLEVRCGLEQAQALALNEGWISWLESRRPLVLVKLAVSEDGCFASITGEPRWISSPASRAQVHRIRRHVDGILVGSQTVLEDDPYLTNRSGAGKQPLRVIADSTLRTSLGARVYQTNSAGDAKLDVPVIVATTLQSSRSRREEFVARGIEVFLSKSAERSVDLEELIGFLGMRGVQTLLCEGGAALATSLLDRKLFDYLLLYRAPIIMGENGKRFYRDIRATTIESHLRVQHLWTRRCGPDTVSLYKRA